MPGYLLTQSAQVKCGHGGPATLTIPAPRVSLSNVIAVSGNTVVACAAGCPNQMPTVTPAGPPGPVLPNPCTVTKLGTACITTRVTSMGQPLAIQGPGPASDSVVPLALPAPPPPLAPANPPVPMPLQPIANAGQTRVFAI